MKTELPVQDYLASNLLHLIVMPTEQCNFRCTYCYEDFAGGRMSPEVVSALKRFLSSRASDLDRLSIAWFGGEPLLALDIIDEVQSHAQALAGRHPRLGLFASMTTNGYLLDKSRLDRLLALGVRQYQVSVDGPRELHDRRRVTAGGKGTFDRIWENLSAASRTEGDFEILVRVHLDEESRDSIQQFNQQYRETLGSDPRFRLLLRPLSRLGGPNDGELPVLGAEERSTAMTEARRHARELDLGLRIPGESLSVCYAARANSFVVRSDGGLAKCTVALSHPGNAVGRLLEDGRVALDSAKIGYWMRGLWSGNRKQLACPLVGYADAFTA